MRRRASGTASPGCSRVFSGSDIRLKDINTTQSSLEDIFVDLVRNDA